MEEKLKQYFEGKNFGKVVEVKELIDGNSSNHLNYKVITFNGVYIARVTKPVDMLSYSSLPDEYVILKMIEKYDISPKAITIDLENFDTPLMVEEFLDGVSYDNLDGVKEEIFDKTIDLLINTSNISISIDEFPFKFSYGTYQTNLKVWDYRMKEIEESLGMDHFLVSGFKEITESAKKILKEKDLLLTSAPKEFIYNDVHPGNIFWIAKENKAKFIDWQKVSIGNPTFMACLFARRFGHLWNMDQTEFSKRVLEVYRQRKNISNLEELFYSSILERAVSDMIWSIWADIKRNISIKINNIEDNKYYKESRMIISGM